LDIGGYRYTTSVQTLRRLSHTSFDAYFSGRYAMDRCDDGSIFIDRDGEHFGQVLEYLRDGVLSVAERDAAELDMSVLRWLKREMGFYCIELMVESQEVAFAVGGCADDGQLASVERYDVLSGAWREAAPMREARRNFGLCELEGELYVTGGTNDDGEVLASVERYDPNQDTWSAAPAMPCSRYGHRACAVGDAMYLLGGVEHTMAAGSYVLSSVLRFDSRTQTWSEVAEMPAQCKYAGMCVVGNTIYIFGGGNAVNVMAPTTYRYRTETNTWAILTPMPVADCGQGVCVVDGLIYVMGGNSSDNVALSSVHRFDPVANSWSEMAPMCVPRTSFGAFVLGGSIHVVGGWDGQRKVTSMERYCVASDRWSEVGGGDLSQARVAFHVEAIRREVDLFDSLMAKAKRDRQ
jgi:hypothetical protein